MTHVRSFDNPRLSQEGPTLEGFYPSHALTIFPGTTSTCEVEITSEKFHEVMKLLTG